MEKGQSDKAIWQVLVAETERGCSFYPNTSPIMRKIQGVSQKTYSPELPLTPSRFPGRLEGMGLRNGQGHDCPPMGVRGLHIW